MPVKYGAKTQEKKQIKTVEDMGYTVIPENCIKCMECGSIYSVDQNNTWQSSSPIHAGNTALTKVNKTVDGKKQIVREVRSHVPYCKNCLLKDLSLDDSESIKRLLFRLDIPYKRDLWQSTKDSWNGKSTDGFVGTYKKNISLSFDGERFIDSDEIESHYSLDQDEEIQKRISKPELAELKRAWGHHYTNNDLIFLRDKYEDWTTRHKCDEYSEEILFQQLSIKELEIRKGREKDQNVDKQVEAMQKLIKDANVQPSTMNATRNSENVSAYGIWVQTIEKHRPAEYFEDKTLFEDFDGIVELFNRFVKRPLKNLLTGSRDFDPEYSVEDNKNES